MQFHLDRVLAAYDYLRIEGWVFAENDPLTRVELFFGEDCVYDEREQVGLPTPSVQLHPSCGFVVSCLVKNVGQRTDGWLRFTTASGATATTRFGHEESKPQLLDDRFRQMIRELPETGRRRAILEVGSRARSGVIRRDEYAQGFDYLGIDIFAGDNVDMVVDVHEMSRVLGRDRFDVVFSHMVLEHVAMPWKAAIEMNRVMREGGVMYCMSTQTCGMHAMPWDYWRFSDNAYRTLFNRATGFEIIDVRLSLPMYVYPFVHSPGFNESDKGAGFFFAEVLAKKVSDTALDWPVELREIISDSYPEGSV